VDEFEQSTSVGLTGNDPTHTVYFYSKILLRVGLRPSSITEVKKESADDIAPKTRHATTALYSYW
jgi:hypothetical protein